jgi:hypothetical protein
MRILVPAAIYHEFAAAANNTERPRRLLGSLYQSWQLQGYLLARRTRKEALVQKLKQNEANRFQRIRDFLGSGTPEPDKHFELTEKLFFLLNDFEAKWKSDNEQTRDEIHEIITRLDLLSQDVADIKKKDADRSQQLEKFSDQLSFVEQLVRHVESSNVNRYDYLEADRNIFRQINGVDATETGRRIRRIGRKLSVAASVEHAKIRMGAQADGGYVCLNDFGGIKTALSFGIDNDVSWDLDIAGRGVIVHQFDHTVDGAPVPHQNFRFNKQMIAPNAEDGHASIGSILQLNSLSEPASVVLKIDIEGNEWDVFDSTPEHELAIFSQIICEFHGFQFVEDDAFFQKVDRVLTKLEALFQVVHVHGNNYCPMFSIGGVAFPSLLEVTFINRHRSTFCETKEVFPTSLDQPNNQNRPDFFLGRFVF